MRKGRKAIIAGVLTLLPLVGCSNDPRPIYKDPQGEIRGCTFHSDGTHQGTCEILDDRSYDVIWDPKTGEWSIDTLWNN